MKFSIVGLERVAGIGTYPSQPGHRALILRQDSSRRLGRFRLSRHGAASILGAVTTPRSLVGRALDRGAVVEVRS